MLVAAPSVGNVLAAPVAVFAPGFTVVRLYFSLNRTGMSGDLTVESAAVGWALV